jgi:hypothetical protein
MEIKDYITAGVALYGAALSSVLAYLNWAARRSGAKIGISYGMLTFGAKLSDQQIIITVSNPRSRPITIAGVGVRLPNGKTLISFGGGTNHPLPHRLEEGASMTAWIALDEVKHHLQKEGYSPGARISGFGRDAMGRTFRSRGLSVA